MTPKAFRTEEPEGKADAVAMTFSYDLQVRTSKAMTPKDHMSIEGSALTCFSPCMTARVTSGHANRPAFGGTAGSPMHDAEERPMSFQVWSAENHMRCDGSRLP